MEGDVLLRGGTVIDAAADHEEVGDVLVRGGVIEQVGDCGSEEAGTVVDCTGAFVVPGLVDAHCHIFDDVTTLGAPVEEGLVQRGVLVAADAGSAGAATFAAFRKFVVGTASIPIFSFLNVSVLGILDPRFGELLNPATLSEDDAVTVATTHPDIVKGFKIRLSEEVVGRQCLPLLERAASVARRASLPLMVHIGETTVPLPAILEHLQPGDIVSHCFTGKRNGILDHDGVLPQVLDARHRGVLFDSAHGKSNLSFGVGRVAVGHGFLPDIITSDMSRRNWRGPVYDLVTTMSKFLALGVTLADVVSRTTIAPARLLGVDAAGFGRLGVGTPANVTVLRIVDEECEFHDAEGEALRGPRLEPVYVLRNGEDVSLVPWRGQAV